MKGQLAAGQSGMTSAQRAEEEQRHLRNMLSKAADEAERAGQLPSPAPSPQTHHFPRKPFFIVSSPHVQKKMAP